jgi:hypothetical protein
MSIPQLSHEDINSLTLAVFDLMVDMGYNLDENNEWDQLQNLIMDKLDKFSTGYRNYN